MRIEHATATVGEIEEKVTGATIAIGHSEGAVVLVFAGRAYPIAPESARKLAASLLDIAADAELWARSEGADMTDDDRTQDDKQKRVDEFASALAGASKKASAGACSTRT